MKFVFTLAFLIFISPILMAQESWDKFAPIASMRDGDPRKLAIAVTKPYAEDVEKVQAIYYWITNNIKYDYKLFEKTKKKKSKSKKVTKEKLKEQNKKEISKTLSSKKGICQQYSLLFQAMCDGIGIQSEIVTGYAKGASKIASLGEKHAWNAVYVGENWYLVDATFGAGYVDDYKKFVSLFDPSYFFSNPDAFKMNHHPKQARYQYTSSPLSKTEYKSNPGIGIGYFEYGIDMLSPNQGKYSVKKGEPIEISFTSDTELDALNIGSAGSRSAEVDAQYKSSANTYTISINTEELKSGIYAVQNGRKLLFTYRFNIN